jgi:hypothetical protein
MEKVRGGQKGFLEMDGFPGTTIRCAQEQVHFTLPANGCGKIVASRTPTMANVRAAGLHVGVMLRMY